MYDRHSQKVFDVLDKNIVDVVLQRVTQDEIDWEKGVWVANQLFNSHVDIRMVAAVNSCELYLQYVIWSTPPSILKILWDTCMHYYEVHHQNLLKLEPIAAPINIENGTNMIVVIPFK